MNLIQLIFELLKSFVPMNETKRASLQIQGEEWYKDLDANPETSNRFLVMLKSHGEKWFVQVGFAVSYIFLSKYIHDFLNPSQEDEDDN